MYKNIVSSFRDDAQNCIFVLYKDGSIVRFELSSSNYTNWFEPGIYQDGADLSEVLWCALTQKYNDQLHKLATKLHGLLQTQSTPSIDLLRSAGDLVAEILQTNQAGL